MLLGDSLSLPRLWVSRSVKPIRVKSGGTAEEEFLSNFEKLMVPELVLVQNICRVELTRATTAQAFNGFAIF